MFRRPVFWLAAAAVCVAAGIFAIIYFPSATDEDLGSDRWSAGPSAVFLMMPGKWVIGALVSNVWSFAGGDQDDANVNSFLLQYFVNYNLPNQWYLSSAPILTANWKAESDKWLIPFGGGFGKIFSIGGQPVNGQVQAFWNAIVPNSGGLTIRPPVGGLPPEASDAGSWTLRLQLQMLFPR